MVNLNLVETNFEPNDVNPSKEPNDNAEINKNADFEQAAAKRRESVAKAGKKPRRSIKELGIFKGVIKILPLIILVLSISGIWYSTKQLARGAGLNLTVVGTLSTITNVTKEPELLKDSSGKRTNFLIVGKDTREFSNGLQNTDTIIFASYNYETNEITMISIPRDFYAGLPGESWYVKINSIYNRYEAQKAGTGLPALITSVEDILGEEIQYYGMVDLAGFKEIIDIVGGVDVYVDRSFTDYQYPNPKPTGSPYITVTFKEGPQTMDAETALIYSRSRHSQGPEGSDYARARRQQKVINAVMAKILSSETFLNPDKALSIAQSLSANTVVSPYTLNEVKAGLALADELKESKSYSFVLDPAIGGSKLVKTGVAENVYAIGPRAGLGKYDDIHTYIDLVMENPAFFSENSKIYVYDIGIGNAEASKITSTLQKQYPFHNIVYGGTLRSDQTENYLFYNNEVEKMEATLEVFKTKLKISNTSKPEFVKNGLYGEHVSIMLAVDPGITSSSAETSQSN